MTRSLRIGKKLKRRSTISMIALSGVSERWTMPRKVMLIAVSTKAKRPPRKSKTKLKLPKALHSLIHLLLTVMEKPTKARKRRPHRGKEINQVAAATIAGEARNLLLAKAIPKKISISKSNKLCITIINRLAHLTISF